MPYTFVLTATLPASAQEIYETWLDSLGHSEMTGGEATMSDEVGAEVSAWDGYITGRNLELIPGRRIVQSWRTSEFSDEYEDSIITVLLREIDEGTLLTLEHKNVPDEQRSYEEGGWQENYFEPMVAYFTERQQKAAVPPAKKAAAKGAPKAAPKKAAKSAGKAKRASSAKSKRAAPRKKAAPKKSKAKAGRIKAAARKRAKPSARKSKRGKRK